VMVVVPNARLAMNMPTILTPGNVRSRWAFMARKCSPVVSTSSTIAISVGGGTRNREQPSGRVHQPVRRHNCHQHGAWQAIRNG
jgi:hypothetical protein